MLFVKIRIFFLELLISFLTYLVSIIKRKKVKNKNELKEVNNKKSENKYIDDTSSSLLNPDEETIYNQIAALEKIPSRIDDNQKSMANIDFSQPTSIIEDNYSESFEENSANIYSYSNLNNKIEGKNENEETVSTEFIFHPKILEKKFQDSYYKEYIIQRSKAADLSDQEIDKFLNDLYDDRLQEILSWEPNVIENFFYNSLKRFEFIGDLPISNQAFSQFVDYLRKVALYNGRVNQLRIPPALFLISMVFCARYSDSEVRNFWIPYASMVWNQKDASGNFQSKCRRHFINCREDLQRSLTFNFNITTRGDVVRPVYQHAIIPSYLQGNFANWLVDNYENLLKYPENQLTSIMQNEKSLEYMPPRLRNFLRDEETNETAARLISRMSNAIKLFYEVEQPEAIDSIISSAIEKSLWNIIYKLLVNNQPQKDRIRKITSKMEWLWNVDDEDISLQLSNIRAKQTNKPDSIVWVKSDVNFLSESDIFIKIYPWKLSTGDWEVDPIQIPSKGPLDGRILVLSENFDLEKDKPTQQSEIIFDRAVPEFREPILFFQIKPQQNIAIRKDYIDRDGAWIIVTNEPIQVINSKDEFVEKQPRNLPSILRKSGFSFVGDYDIQLPTKIKVGGTTKSFDKVSFQEEVKPFLCGKEKVVGLSRDIPPVFRTPEIKLTLWFNSKLYSHQHTWMSVFHDGNFLHSINLADLERKQIMNLEVDKIIIDLTTLLKQSGSYKIDLLNNMRSLLDTPIQFSWLPEHIEINGPSSDSCYSPSNPLVVTIRNISECQDNDLHVIPIYDEKCKLTNENNSVIIKWKILKSPRCGFSLHWKNSLIHFHWDVDRVAAWIEGGGDKKQVDEDMMQHVTLQIRGQKNESFSWINERNNEQRNSNINAKGEFQARLEETELRDMLLKVDHVKTTVSISMRGYNWKLFDYFKNPGIKIINVNYERPQLRILFTQTSKLIGDYVLQINRVDHQSKPMILGRTDTLNEDYNTNVQLDKGKWRIEILLFDNLIATSSIFEVIADPKQIADTTNRILFIDEADSSNIIFHLLSASKQILLKKNYSNLSIAPMIQQLQIINTPERWITNEPWNDCFKLLLPSWAVLAYPLRLTTKDPKRVLHLYPEKVLYGGKAGRGYVELLFGNEKMKVAASWRPAGDPYYSRLWMGVSEKQEINFFSKLDQNDLWPVYKCKTCGSFLASRNGTYLKLTPSLVYSHLHGKQRTIDEQFIDTVYDDQNPVEVSIAQYKQEDLHHAYSPEEVVSQNYLQGLIEGKIKPINQELEKPIDMYSSKNYNLAVSELYKMRNVSSIKNMNDNMLHFNQLYQYMQDEKDRVPAFAAFHRIMQHIREETPLYSIPGNVLSLTMVIRLKSNMPDKYYDLLNSLTISGDNISKIIDDIIQCCPKLLEWTIAWAELFFIHAVS